MDGAFPSEKGQPFDNLGGGGGYGRGGAPRRGFRGTAENAKTKLCTRWQQGDCRFGDRCNFAHGEEELRKLPPREDGGRFGGPGRGGPGRGGYGGGYNGGRGGPAPYGGGRGRGYDDYGYGGGGGGGYGGGQGGGYGGGPQGGGYGGHAGDRPQGGQGGYGAPAGGAGDQGAARMGAGGAAGGQMPEDVWAANGYPVQGPNGWVMYKTKDTGEPYYHNHRTNTTQWERPADWPAN